MKSIDPFRLLQDAVVYVACVTPIVVLRDFAEPYHRCFYCDDESIRYPNLPSTISTITLILVGVIVPLAIILAVEAYRLYKVEPRMHGYARILPDTSTVTVDIPETMAPSDRTVHRLLIRVFTYAGAFVFGASVCETLTDAAKITLGELRPYFLEACQPDWTRINCSNHRCVSDYACQNTDTGLIREARQSFPSGHASFAAYCACFAVLYLRDRASWPLSATTGRLVRPLVQYALVLTAFVTGLTRVADNQHHGMDVAFGFVLGTLTAFATCYHFEIFWSSRKAEDESWAERDLRCKCTREDTDKESSALLYQD